MAQHVAGTVDARPLAVPDAEHAVELALAAQFRLLRAPQRGGGEILVQTGLKHDIVRLEHAFGALELIVEPAERRAAVAGDVAGGIEAGAAVALLLHQAHAHQRLIAGDEHPALGQIVFIREGYVPERHRAFVRDRWRGVQQNLRSQSGRTKPPANDAIPDPTRPFEME